MQSSNTQSRSSAVNEITVPPGQWKLKRNINGLNRTKRDNLIEDLSLNFDSSNSQVALAVERKLSNLRDGTKVRVQAHLTENTLDNDDSEVHIGPALNVERVNSFVRIIHPDGSKTRTNLEDNGSSNNEDETRGDNIFSGVLILKKPGKYRIKTVFKGDSENGKVKYSEWYSVFVSEARFKVKNYTVTPTDGHILGEVVEDGRYGIPLKVTPLRGKVPEIVDTRAEIWAKDSNGRDVVVGWTGGLVQPQKKSNNTWYIPFTFHSDWLAQGDFSPPLSLREITVNDIDNGDQLLFSNNPIELGNIGMFSSSRNRIDSNNTGPTLSMTKGVHPSILSGKFSAREG